MYYSGELLPVETTEVPDADEAAEGPGAAPPRPLARQDSQQQHSACSSDEEMLFVSLTCADCLDLFPTRHELLAHRRRAHPGRKAYQCPACMAAFPALPALRSHRDTHTADRPHACDRCGQRFSRRCHVQSHVRALHRPPRPPRPHEQAGTPAGEHHRCTECADKVFLSAAGLASHVTKFHVDERAFACKVCHTKFSNRYSLSRHTKKQHPSE